MKGPTKKEEQKKEIVPKKEQKEKKVKPKSVQLTTWIKGDVVTSFDEFKAACKTRKRKERQESISSLCQERKVIRSNSEERPKTKKSSENDSNIRRVSSSEDFQNARNSVKNNRPPEAKSIAPLTEILAESNIDVIYDEFENERRRSHERFAKPLTLKCKRTRKYHRGRTFPKVKYKDATTDLNCNEQIPSRELQDEAASTRDIEKKLSTFLQLSQSSEKERSPSPVHTPSLDLTTLHQQFDDSEPLPSCSNRGIDEEEPNLSVVSKRLLSSPRNSIIATHCIHLDPNISYPSVNKTLNPIEQKLQKVSKHINGIKKKIKKFEADFLSQKGYKPTQLDKMSDKNVKQLYADLAKSRKEMKALQENSDPDGLKDDRPTVEGSIKECLIEIEIRLKDKRELADRSENLEEMSSDQLIEEKIAVQKALLYLESLYGRPSNKEDRDLVRPLYDRYRTLKRMVCKISMSSSNTIDLETIHEDEAMTFVADSSVKSNETPTDKTSTFSTITDSDTDVSVNENLHAMSQSELEEELRGATEEKKVLKRMIKEYETEVQLKTGKMLQKDDKVAVQHLYMNYKKTKAKLRLLDALISKNSS